MDPGGWLEDEQKIKLANASTYYGRISFAIESGVSAGKIIGTITMPDRTRPETFPLHLQHPPGELIGSVTVIGVNWKDFGPQKE